MRNSGNRRDEIKTSLDGMYVRRPDVIPPSQEPLPSRSLAGLDVERSSNDTDYSIDF